MAKKKRKSKAARVKWYTDRLYAARHYARQTTPDYGAGANEIAASFRKPQTADPA